MEVNVGVRGDAADFFERLECAEFVVGVHDSEEDCFRVNCFAQFFKLDLAIESDREIGHCDAVFFKSLASVEDSFVFDGSGDDVPR